MDLTVHCNRAAPGRDSLAARNALPERTRVILVGLPRLLEEIVAAAIVAEDDLVLTGSVRHPARLPNGSSSVDADVVITGEHDAEAAVAFLHRYPRLKVLALARDGESSSLYELRPVLLPLGQLSPAGLVAALRRAAAPVYANFEP
jgi:hypothetical protein